MSWWRLQAEQKNTHLLETELGLSAQLSAHAPNMRRKNDSSSGLSGQGRGRRLQSERLELFASGPYMYRCDEDAILDCRPRDSILAAHEPGTEAQAEG